MAACAYNHPLRGDRVNGNRMRVTASQSGLLKTGKPQVQGEALSQGNEIE